MKTNVVVQGAALTPNVSNRSLSEGSSVYVRVLKNLGGNRFTVSFAGSRFDITSKIPLSEGQSFNAKIKIENQKIFLVQMMNLEAGKAVLENQTGFFDQNGRILNPEVIKYFEKLGLFPDYVNYSLFQMMKELGLNFSRELFNQARKIALRFPGRESESAKTVFLLKQKGLDSGEKSVRKILEREKEESEGGKEKFTATEDDSGSEGKSSFSEGASSGFENNSGSESDSSPESPLSLEETIFLSFKNGFDSLLKKTADKKNPYGILSLFNHSGFLKNGLKNSGSWVKIPFECNFSRGEKTETARGELCFFIRCEDKKAEKCAVKVTFFEKIYKFVVSLKGGSGKVLISRNMDISSLKKRFPEIEFEYASLHQGEDFPVDEESFLTVDGRV